MVTLRSLGKSHDSSSAPPAEGRVRQLTRASRFSPAEPLAEVRSGKPGESKRQKNSRLCQASKVASLGSHHANVGREMLSVLAERRFPVSGVLLASTPPVGHLEVSVALPHAPGAVRSSAMTFPRQIFA